MQYLSPATLEDAATLLAAQDGDCRILAGGTDLLVRMRSGFAEPDSILDIKRIEDLRTIKAEDGGFRIGAAVSGAQMGEHADLSAAWPGLVEAAGLIGSTQIQGRATIVGNLCNASPAADSVPALVAADATVRITSAGGNRDVPVIDVPTGPGQTLLKRGEFVSSVFLPQRPPRSADAYVRFIPRTEMDIAVVGCGVSVTLAEDGTCTQARIALGAVAPTVLLVTDAAGALIGTKLEDEALEAAASLCSAAATPITDKRGTVEFRTHVAGVLARRALQSAAQRAGQSS